MELYFASAEEGRDSRERFTAIQELHHFVVIAIEHFLHDVVELGHLLAENGLLVDENSEQIVDVAAELVVQRLAVIFVLLRDLLQRDYQINLQKRRKREDQ